MPDREKVIGHLNDCMEASRRDNTWIFVRKDIVGDAIDLLKEQEAVVRCKDCKHLERLPNLDYEDVKAMVCRKHTFTGMRVEDWFCADGERRDDDA